MAGLNRLIGQMLSAAQADTLVVFSPPMTAPPPNATGNVREDGTTAPSECMTLYLAENSADRRRSMSAIGRDRASSRSAIAGLGFVLYVVLMPETKRYAPPTGRPDAPATAASTGVNA